MNRQEHVTRHVTKEKRGIEIGAWHSGIAPKREGYDCLILDVFDTPTLHKRARGDMNIPQDLIERIEEVDIVGSSTEIAELVEVRGELGQFDYIISSHNLEHCPDPVKFFQGCEKVLKPGGYLSMILPDKRGCFDFYRPVSTAGSVLAAFMEKRTRPTYQQVYEFETMAARRLMSEGESIVFHAASDPKWIVPFDFSPKHFEEWRDRIESRNDSYKDAHCWVFTPTSFELIVLELNALGLTNMRVDMVDSATGEFYVHLRNDVPGQKVSDRRHELMMRASDEVGSTSPTFRRLEKIRRLQNQLDEAWGALSDD